MRLVTYSWLAVVLAVASAAIGWLGIAGWMAAAVLVASIGMHVAGNAIGTRLRDDTDRDLDRLGVRPGARVDVPVARPGHLQRTTHLGLLIPVSAGIGGLAGFLTASFVAIVRHTLREAIAAERTTAPRDRSA